MKKIIYFISVAIIASFQSCDCIQLAYGTVTDSETGDPISGATVQKTGMEHTSAVTDANGMFEVRSISGGLFGCPPMNITVEKEGYQTITHKGGGKLKLEKK